MAVRLVLQQVQVVLVAVLPDYRKHHKVFQRQLLLTLAVAVAVLVVMETHPTVAQAAVA
jgi:hypothetical protein